MLIPTGKTNPQDPTSTTPSLSVVTSVYRSERFLAPFIDEMVVTIEKVGIESYELIFVNDGSPDESLSEQLKVMVSSTDCTRIAPW